MGGKGKVESVERNLVWDNSVSTKYCSLPRMEKGVWVAAAMRRAKRKKEGTWNPLSIENRRRIKAASLRTKKQLHQKNEKKGRAAYSCFTFWPRKRDFWPGFA